ncbi:LexA family protein [Diplocloster agilis]|uniref:Winged helix-turn-helix transcriptional regulator n=1 Tax=Diplocloster agilis TaxID=2850323 RepID=A0A949K1R9_9FIRM|nr:winged helix-turn-helix transcriptional regulator [Diplocloster agilis]MBU9739340.1 winged helix-turn-helix transcriptional regulator [Diplocloster agilis]MBU9746199.1 winged helix-turn-helix transcriptional regulator [Diplocloster agilis]
MKEKVYAYIVDYIIKNGYAPSMREIAADLGIVASTVHIYLKLLEDDGKIYCRHGSPRVIRVNALKITKS